MSKARRSIACSHCVLPRRLINPDGNRGEPTMANDATLSQNLADKFKTEEDSSRGTRSARPTIAHGRDLRGGTGKSAAENGMNTTVPQSKVRARRKFANRPNGTL